MTGTSRPLDGIRILDFSRVLAGPLSTALLADLGAEVIKVEPPTGDDYRVIGPMKNGISSLFTALNRNKKSLVLDLKHADAVAVVHELARQVDVVVENFKPGGLARFGLDYDTVAATNPRVVYASISGFGSGPFEPLLACGLLGSAAAAGSWQAAPMWPQVLLYHSDLRIVN